MTRQMIMPIAFGILGAALLISLGLWQVQRLIWKEAALAAIEARIHAPAVPLPGHPAAEADQYLPVVVEGMFAGRDLAVLVSRKNFGVGYRMVGAMETIGGRRILVERGFTPIEQRDRIGPAAAVRIVGNLHWPDDTDSWTPAPERATNLWFSRDVAAMAAELGTEPVLVVARETSELDLPLTPWPVGTKGIPNDHLHYAITWFSLGAVWLGMTGYLLWRIRQRTV